MLENYDLYGPDKFFLMGDLKYLSSCNVIQKIEKVWPYGVITGKLVMQRNCTLFSYLQSIKCIISKDWPIMNIKVLV